MNRAEYYAESIACILNEMGKPDALSAEEHLALATGLLGSIECEGMAFYTPPPSDRISVIEGDWKKKLNDLQAEFDRYRGYAETAVKRALRQHPSESVSIGEYGEVLRHGGRTVQIQ